MIILYSLPYNCPFPWPSHTATASTKTATSNNNYWSSLYGNNLLFTNHVKLDTYARRLLQQHPSQQSSQPRDHILPIHHFDLKYRSTLFDCITASTLNSATTDDVELLGAPSVVSAASTTTASKKDEKKRKNQGKEYFISKEEQVMLLESYNNWIDQSSSSGSVSAGDAKNDSSSDSKTSGNGASVKWTISNNKIQDWVASLELLETQFQCLLLLCLLTAPTLPSPPSPTSPAPMKKKRKKHDDPERSAATLDPELLLDFLTDRLQIWRVMQRVGSVSAASSIPTVNNGAGAGGNVIGTASTVAMNGNESVGEEKWDAVQEWWIDVVEALFSSLLPPALLSHHHQKLFPSLSATASLLSTTTSLTANGTIIAESPFKARERSLMDLDRSARRRSTVMEAAAAVTVMESPTMKKLLGNRSIMNGDEAMLGSNGAAADIFKLPPLRRRISASNTIGTPPVNSTSLAGASKSHTTATASGVADSQELWEHDGDTPMEDGTADESISTLLLPHAPSAAASAVISTTSVIVISATADSSSSTSVRQPRKQIRPLPLPPSLPRRSLSTSSLSFSTSTTGAAATSTKAVGGGSKGSKALFNNTRREISLVRRPSLIGAPAASTSSISTSTATTAFTSASMSNAVFGSSAAASTVREREKVRERGEKGEAGPRKKRKSVSPRKLANKPSSFLIMNTPIKSTSSSNSSNNNNNNLRNTAPFSFASLGAAFRPGSSSSVSSMPFHIPPPPRLPGDGDEDDFDFDFEYDDAMRWRTSATGAGSGISRGREVKVKGKGEHGTREKEKGWIVPASSPG